MTLAKHIEGAPLTEAELEQRRQAALARWREAVGAGAGGLAGGAIARLAADRARARLVHAARAGRVAAMAPVHHEHKVRAGGIERKKMRRLASFTGGNWPVPAQRLVNRIDLRAAEAEAKQKLDAIPTEWHELFQDHVPIDSFAAGDIQKEMDETRKRLGRAALANAYPPRVVDRAASKRVAGAKEHTRTVKLRTSRLKPLSEAQQRTKALIDAAAQEEGEPAVYPKHWYERERRVLSVGPGRSAGRAATRAKIEGWPNNATLAAMRRELAARLDGYTFDQHVREGRRHADAVARTLGGFAGQVRGLRRFFPRRYKLLASAGGAAAGALAGWGLARATRPAAPDGLGKAFDPDRHPRGERGRFVRPADLPKAIALIGLPGAGKSTWLAQYLATARRPTVAISTDADVEDHARERGLTYSQAFRQIDFKQVETHQRARLRAAAAAGHDIIIDRTNLSPKSRGAWLRALPGRYRREAVLFDVPEDELARRRRLRPGKTIPARNLAEMRAAFRPPAEGEFHAVATVRGGLAKAAPGDTPADRLRAAGDAAEADTGKRLADAFGRWKAQAGEQVLGTRKGTLVSTMLTDLDHATRPLDTALRAGAAQPIPALVHDADGNPRTVAFTFQGRNPAVEAFIDKYRQDKIAELADDQRATIKSVLIDAARTGASPQEMAQRIKGSIGLTAHQLGLVQTFQVQLRTLDPRALGRALRDKRFDPTLRKAIDRGIPLSAEQVEKMVDAYHRRSLALRAMTIARTEGLAAANNGHVAAVQAALQAMPGFTVIKTWIATEDERTREDHADLGGKSVVGLDTPFLCASGDEMRWPHDPSGPARQVCRCRCSLFTRLVPRTVAAQFGPAALDIADPEDAHAP